MGHIVVYFIYTFICWELMKSVESEECSCCHSRWQWWSNTLWVTLTRLWSLTPVMFVLVFSCLIEQPRYGVWSPLLSDLSSWPDFPLENFILIFGQSVFMQSIWIPIGTNCAVFSANIYLFSSSARKFVEMLCSRQPCSDLYALDSQTNCLCTWFRSWVPSG